MIAKAHVFRVWFLVKPHPELIGSGGSSSVCQSITEFLIGWCDWKVLQTLECWVQVEEAGA